MAIPSICILRTISLLISYSSTDKYEIIRKIGRGKYSDVYEGIRTENDLKVAIKILKPSTLITSIIIILVKKAKVKREVKVLQTLMGAPNVVRLVDVVRDAATKTWAIVRSEKHQRIGYGACGGD